jgi:hypothetical protein
MESKIEVQGQAVFVLNSKGKEDYISLTDMAKHKNPNETSLVISHWLSTKYTIEFLGIWETMNNPNFNTTEFRSIRENAGGHGAVISSSQWIERTKAIGIVATAGRYGGTYAHKDIAFEFATWISAEFKYWLIKEFERLKADENKQLEWSAKRELAKLNYHIHTDAIKQNLIVPKLTPQQISFTYENEADLLNVALFGETATQWRKENPTFDGNIRDYATVHQLLILANMESYNAIMIAGKISQADRLQRLNDMARQQLSVLLQVDNKLYLPNGGAK